MISGGPDTSDSGGAEIDPSLPGYAIEELVGVGSSGEVWRARRRDTGDLVALKRIEVQDPAVLRAARAEAALLSAFDHPHILRLHELITLESEAVLVLDFAAGGSLAQVLAHRGSLAPGEVVTVIAPIASALAAAHAEGVIHGDVSAANILFTADGRPLLADLGVARLAGHEAVAVRTTPEYIDPLVARGGPPGPHSDVFMLAAVAWHALTGAAPWAGDTALESLGLAAAGDLARLAELMPAAPPDLPAALDRAMQPSAHLRGSAAELALDTRHAVEPIPVDGWTGRASRSRSAPRAVAPRSSGPRHTAEGRAAPTKAEQPAARPDFRRPARHTERPEAPPGARTRVVRRVPAAPAAPARQERRGTARGRRIAGILSMIAAAGLLSVGAGLWRAQADVTQDGGPRGLAPSNAVLTSAVPPAAVPNVADRWLDELRRLDVVRSEAYQQNRPELLAQVYVPGSLLEQDARQLSSQVPSGCSLAGAVTSYAQLAVRDSTQDAATVEVTASLPAASLTCAGAVQAQSAAVGPVRLVISLARQADGSLRITGQSRS